MGWSKEDQKKYWQEYRKRPEVIAKRKAAAQKRWEEKQKGDEEEKERVKDAARITMRKKVEQHQRSEMSKIFKLKDNE